MESRRNFLKTACATGICSCALADGLHGATPVEPPAQAQDTMPRAWIAAMLPALAAQADPAAARAVMKAAAVSHFEQLRMADKVAQYQGKLDEFLASLVKDWGWKVERSADGREIMVDEGKPTCVCPLVQKGATSRELGVLCYCSEGFAERMFSAVVGGPVRVEVTQSVLRGGATCHYRITLAA